MMMADLNKSVSMRIPQCGALGELEISLDKTLEAENRLIDAKSVNPATYADLEYIFNESYRELKRAYAAVTYRLAKAEEAVDNARATALLDKYPEFVKDKPRNYDNADIRKSFIQRDEDYLKATDHRDQIRAIELLIEGRIKVMERTTSYMKKQMELIIRSGAGGFTPKR
jgi:hypothetical protein